LFYIIIIIQNKYSKKVLFKKFCPKLYFIQSLRKEKKMRMITLAYYLGKLKGIQEVDEGKTPVVLS